MFFNETMCCSLSLDKSCIFFPSSNRVESKPCISGKFRLSLPQAIATKGISVQVRGIAKLPYDEGSFFRSYHEENTFATTHPLASSHNQTSFNLPAGDYEFPFSIPLNSKMLETIAFRGSSYHTYHVHAIIERRFSKNVILSEPIRIYKHFSIEDSLYWMSALNSISKQWDNVAQYSVSIPDVNIPFGATFPLKLWVAPLSKGLKLQALTINVVEQHELKINAPATYSAQFNVHFLSSKKENVIFSEGHSLDDCMTLESGESDIEWSATKWISLPQDLEAYSQDVSSSMIKINHQVEFTVELLGMGGKLSMIKGTIPFNIYMSPQVISEHGTVRRLHVDGSLDEYMDPPPLYSKHQNDLLLPVLRDPLNTGRFAESDVSLRMICGQPLDNGCFNSAVFDCAPSYETVI